MAKQVSIDDTSITKAYIALGSNSVSDNTTPLDVIVGALDALGAEFEVNCTSRFYNTPAFPIGSGPEFVNAVVGVNVAGSAHELLSRLHQIEADAGRKRDVRWGPRSLDLDLLDFGGQISPNLDVYENWLNLPAEQQSKEAPDQLILPHPRLQDRAFVLVPLCDIAPDWRHPVLEKTAQDLCDALPAQLRAEIREIEV